MPKIIYFTLVLPILIIYANSTICRDGSRCPGHTTCCLTPRGVGCCPYTNGVCCGDGFHCCPQGYICGDSTCYRRGGSEFSDAFVEFAGIEKNSGDASTPKDPPSVELEINYILSFCINNRPIETPFREMLLLCDDKDYEKAQSCKFALLHLINEGLIRSVECYDRINALIKRL